MQNPDPRRYREAEIALEFDEATFRGFVRQGRLYGWLKHWDPRRGWHVVEPYLPRAEVERLATRLRQWGLDTRWEDEVLVVDDPQGRWRRARLAPNRDGLYGVAAWGRGVDRSSNVDWLELFPHWPGRPLDGQTIASILDTPLTPGRHPRNRQPVFDRLEREAQAADLVEALSLARTDYARDRLAILLAYHRQAKAATAALPMLVAMLGDGDDGPRRSAATAVREIVSRAGPERAIEVMPELVERLQTASTETDDAAVVNEIDAALGALGERTPTGDAARFGGEVERAFSFLVAEHSLTPPVVVDTALATTVTYRNATTGVVASADWRDGLVEVFVIRLEDGDVPVYVDTEQTNWLSPDWLVNTPIRDDIGPRSQHLGHLLDRYADALRRCTDVLHGDFDLFEAALARSAQHIASSDDNPADD